MWMDLHPDRDAPMRLTTFLAPITHPDGNLQSPRLMCNVCDLVRRHVLGLKLAA